MVDEAHETLSGPATQEILQRAWHEYHDAQCEWLAWLSVAQLYRLRKSGTYRHRRVACAFCLWQSIVQLANSKLNRSLFLTKSLSE